jgi:DHA1 family bicyclomycin/chloramphenicol resistance-like MFS transporter
VSPIPRDEPQGDESHPHLPHAPLWLLAMITLSGTLAMHVFVPALPAARRELGASVGAIQLTIGVYIVGLAIGHLVYGPLSDRYGRRRVLMIGLALFSTAGLAAAMAASVELLVVLRFFQALGGCAGMVIGRAMVRDTSAPKEAMRRLALMNLMMSVGPGGAPLVGGALVSILGWRSIYYALALFGAVNFVLAWRRLAETRRAPADASGTTVTRHYLRLAKSPRFLAYAIGGGCATTSFWAFITAAPFVFVNQLHRPAHEVGFYLAFLISGMGFGSILATRLNRRYPLRHLLMGANAVIAASAGTLTVVTLAGALSVGWVAATMFVFVVGAAIVSPAALTEAISLNPSVIGSASGLYGFMQMAVAAVCATLVGLGSNPALSSGLVLLGATLTGQACFRYASHGPRS